jgi:hypothetical protein
MLPSSRFLHVLGFKWNRKVKSFDVENAFQIMEIPQGFEKYFDRNFDRKTDCLELHNA